MYNKGYKRIVASASDWWIKEGGVTKPFPTTLLSANRVEKCEITLYHTSIMLSLIYMTLLLNKNMLQLHGTYIIELSHWYKVNKVFYTPEAKLRCVKITSYITKRS